jgi:hypothetical protein
MEEILDEGGEYEAQLCMCDGNCKVRDSRVHQTDVVVSEVF